MKLFRKRIVFYSYVTLGIFLFEIVFPATASALTGGPSTPEVQSFEPIGTSDMVDIFSGDFQYNIPLMEVDGYPVNISYSGGVNMDQEASWVGLGWNLNPGVINRNMRGVPDDFAGDEILQEMSMKANTTVGIKTGASIEIFGLKFKQKLAAADSRKGKSISPSAHTGIFFNNYTGAGVDAGISIGLGQEMMKKLSPSMSAGLSLNFNSTSGISIQPSANFSLLIMDKKKKADGLSGGLSATAGYNSRSGMRSLNFGYSLGAQGLVQKVSGTGSAIIFGSQTYTPTQEFPMNTFSFSGQFAYELPIMGFDGEIFVNAYFTRQALKVNSMTKHAYGYKYLENGNGEEIMDLNREHDQPFSENHTKLPIPVNTADIFSVSGHGVGGTFRLYRNDIVNYREGGTESNSNDVSVGFEVGALKIAKYGLNVSYTNSRTETGNWSGGNELQNRARLVKSSENPEHPEYEPSYFRQMGEHTGSTLVNNASVHGYYLVAPQVIGDQISGGFTKFSNKSDPTAGKHYLNLNPDAIVNSNAERQPRNTLMCTLTAGQAYYAGLNSYLKWFGYNQLPIGGILTPENSTPRYGSYRKTHHISEVNIVGTDGMRYIYDLPAYNITQTEITFSVEGGANCITGLVKYSAADISVSGNTKGTDRFVQKTTTPGYAYAYHLTGIVSPDYVDLRGDGITDDDHGTAIKFNYASVGTYKWRVPFAKDSANFSEGKKTDALDNKASIIYGEKEIYYLHSIVGKNHIALFYVSPRGDGAGVENINGGNDPGYNSVMYKLDSIVLYNKQDFLENGFNAYKIKGAHFTYDYSLCEGVANFITIFGDGDANKGKLTLKSIHFTYGSSFKGKLSPYSFTYNNPPGAEKIAYNSKGQDRWGVYQPVNGSSCGGVNPNSSEFPYTTQDKSLADEYSGAWCLSEILLPSGGQISVEYESDDYAYVQDRQAMSMYKIAGFSPSTNEADLSNLLYTIADNEVNQYVFFDLGQATTEDEFETIINDIRIAQFTVLADINGKGKYEYVRGYFDVDQDENTHGVCSTDNELGYCKMVWVPIKDNDRGRHVSPISKNIWNWARMNTPDLLYNRNVEMEPGVGKEIVRVMYSVVGFYNEVVNMATGLYANLRARGFGQKVALEGSWIRLNARNHTKLGGGHRVKSIRINDNWAVMGDLNTDAVDAEYGQEYSYTMDETMADGSTETISSGVAQYEPQIGSEENPLHMPEYRTEELKLAPDLQYMNDVPYGESYMPSASVGYRQVTVKNLSHTGVKKSATGRTVYQFYTAKEFPAKISYSPIQVNIVKPSFADQLFNLDRVSENKASAGQGYLIELNDMHGKPKAELIYSETSVKPIGGVMHEYLTNPNNPNELYNKVKVVEKSGAITEKEIATEVEVFNDFRQSLSEVTSVSVQTNLDFFTIAFVPIAIPAIWGSYSKDFTKVQTAVTVKIVNRYGIESSTIAIKEGSQIKTDNLLYDGMSGNVLVSRVQNEFDDNIYGITTPAHWAYDQGMGPGYKNIGIEISGVMLRQDSILLPNGLNPRDYFVPGDYVLVTSSTFPEICQVYEGKNSKLNLIQAQHGEPHFPANSAKLHTLRIIRSGRKNLHNLPIQQISALHNPTLTSTLDIDSVISTSAIEYKELWPFYCDSYYEVTCDTTFGIPIETIQDYFNDLFQLASFNSGSTYMDTACARGIINAGYYEWRDTLYAKYLVGGVPTISMVSDDSCITCIDSLFIETSENQFFGIPVSSFSSCLVSSMGCNLVTNYADEIENHLLYEKMRYFIDSLDPCIPEQDTTFGIEVYANYPGLFGYSDIEINYNKCGLSDCPGYIDIIDNTVCYKRIMEIVSITQRDNEYFDAQIRVQLKDGSYDTLAAEGTLHCIPMMWVDCSGICITPTTSTILNPYKIGMLGNWRPSRNYAFVGTRNYSSTPNPRVDGTFTSFTPFWAYNSGTGELNKSTSTSWVWASEVTKYTPFGNEIENKDALGRYSSAVFGFNYTLPIAVGGNAKYEQLAYEGFEENSLFWQNANCYEGHFTFAISSSEQGEITDEISHSGNYSVKVNSGEEISSSSYELSVCESYVDPLDSNAMKWQNCNCVGKFSPKAGKYIVSAWVKQGDDPLDTTYANAKIQAILYTSGGSSTVNFIASGPIIEGWQRIYGELEIGGTVESVEFILVSSLTVDSWFDDFRVHPFNANMKSYAYDQITLRLMAELDENNFATFYEYDQEGALIRVKKETERGVKTLKEVRKRIFKAN